MSLKFTFGGASAGSHDHTDHATGGAPSGIPLPFAGAATPPVSASSVLEMRITLTGEDAAEVLCEGLSGDGVAYSKASVPVDGRPLHLAVRSALARAGAELPEPLITSVTGVSLSVGGREAEVLEALGLTVAVGSAQLATIDEALQARTGIAAGTPITQG